MQGPYSTVNPCESTSQTNINFIKAAQSGITEHAGVIAQLYHPVTQHAG